MPNAVIAGYVRSPFHLAGKGDLARVRADDLAAQVIRGLVEHADGTEVATIESTQRVEFVTLRPDGSVSAVRSLSASSTSSLASSAFCDT